MSNSNHKKEPSHTTSVSQQLAQQLEATPECKYSSFNICMKELFTM